MNPRTESIYHQRFDRNYNRLFKDAFRITIDRPSHGIFWLKTLLHQKRMARRRKKEAKNGNHIPPVMILSITRRCNLRCKGCYAMNVPENHPEELPAGRVKALFREASDLGIGVILIAGGEPLMRPDVLEAAGQHPGIIFPVFTNGTMVNAERTGIFKEHRNLLPVLSIEGNRSSTDNRRGMGTFDMLRERMAMLRRANLLFGMSITLTSNNFDEVTDPVWMHENVALGCRYFFLVEYVPQSTRDMDQCLTDHQKSHLKIRLERLRKEMPALFICLPGDEAQYGGCLAAGRGFIHISADGSLEPCPFAPYSDIGIREMSLIEALQSPFLERIRQSHNLLTEARGGCTLWENRDWVRRQLEEVVAEPACDYSGMSNSSVSSCST